MTTQGQTVREMVQAILDADCNINIWTNDAGNGSAGPSYLDAESIQALLDSGEVDEYEIVPSDTRAHGDEDERTIIEQTCHAHGADNDPTPWLLAERVDPDDTGSNPYRHYLLLWRA